MKKYLWTPAFCLGMLLLASALPASAGVYFGGSVGQGSADISAGDLDDGSFTSMSAEDSDTQWKVYGGWRFFRFFAVEAAWNDLGEVSTSATSDGSGLIWASGQVTQVGEADGISVSTLGVFPIGKFSLFAKLGYLFWDADTTLTNDAILGGSMTLSDDGEDTMFGAGVVWNYTGPGSARLEYEQSKIDDLDVDTISAGLSFMF